VRSPFVARPFVHHSFVHHRFARPFVPFVAIAPPVVIYTPAPLYDSTPSEVYGAPSYSRLPDVYGATGSGAVAAAPAPTPPPPSVVQYSTGRYELRGDGVTTLYRWVWIPNPPPPPAEPPEATPSAPPASGDAAPARHTRVYRWIDDQGVAHWTDQAGAVPPQDRARAARTPSY